MLYNKKLILYNYFNKKISAVPYFSLHQIGVVDKLDKNEMDLLHDNSYYCKTSGKKL